MTVRTAWPWISALLGVAAAVNPFGLAVISAAIAGEQLAHTIGLVLLGTALAVLVLIAVIEFGIRKFLMARQRRRVLGETYG